MKNLILFCLFMLGLCSQAQTLKTITIVPQRSYYLNGGLRATAAGGVSRETIKIDLPPNTKSWYYSFSTAPGADGTELLNLGIQLSAMMYGGLSGPSIASSIKVPKGSGSADVFVLTPSSRDLFLLKDDEKWRFFKDISLQNTLQAVQYVNPSYGTTLYLGLRNPSSLTGIAIYIEVTAIVEEQNPNYDKGITYGNLGWKAFESGEYNKCLEFSKKALDHDTNLYFVKFNIALVHLVQAKDDCLDIYIDAIASVDKDRNPKSALQGALQDIRDLKLKKPKLKYIADIESLLIEKIGSY